MDDTTSLDDVARLPQGDIRLLAAPLAQRLLRSTIPARMAYTARNGTPRVVATWFHWTGDELVMPTFRAAPHVNGPARRLRALRERPDVAVTIDSEGVPAGDPAAAWAGDPHGRRRRGARVRSSGRQVPG